MVLEPLPSLRWGECAQAHKASGHSLGRQEWGDPLKVASRDARPLEGRIVTSHIIWVWEWVCTYMYIRSLLYTMRFKVVMAVNLSELRN